MSDTETNETPQAVDEPQPAPVEVAAAEEAVAAEPLSELELLQQQVAVAAQDKQETYERLLRATADLDNFRKRSRRELQDAKIEARTRVLKEMLPVIDNLERAVQHAESGEKVDETTAGILDGVRLVLRQFSQALERCEVTSLEATGKAFDPNVHEAISQIETADQPPGTVVSAVQRGYKIGDRLLRPSLVVVAKAPSTEPAVADEPAEVDATPSEDSAEE